MIRHSVIFKLNYPIGSAEERNFLEAGKKLSTIAGVRNFECLRQISKKNDFDYGLSMEFENQTTYDAYSHHPDHVKFIENYWLKGVEKFLEIDYELMA